jgi:hypothetical protein
MSDLLHQLENNEAILLMYLADELSDADREEVEHLLRSDATMRRELQRLQGLHQDQQAAFDQLDAAQPLELRRGTIIRRASRAIRQWDAERKASAAPADNGETDARRKWFFYPMGTAAAVLLGMLLWWGYRSPVHLELPPDARFAHYEPWGYPLATQDYHPLNEIEQQYAALRNVNIDDPLIGIDELLMQELFN